MKDKDKKSICPSCAGSGFENDSVTPCMFCGGDGWVFTYDVALSNGEVSEDEKPWNYEDALEHADSIEVHRSELKTFFKCAGCDFPHHSEQQAINCCPPVQVFACPTCDSYRYSEQEARECCR